MITHESIRAPWWTRNRPHGRSPRAGSPEALLHLGRRPRTSTGEARIDISPRAGSRVELALRRASPRPVPLGTMEVRWRFQLTVPVVARRLVMLRVATLEVKRW